MAADERFLRVHRIRGQADFDRAFAQGKMAMDGRLIVHAIRNQRAWSRLGISVSRKVGSAPVRNRWKRVIREAFRRSRAEMPSGLDMVVRPRRGAVPTFADVRRSLVRLSLRLAQNLEQPM